MSELEQILNAFESMAATSSRLKKDEIVQKLIKHSKVKVMLCEIIKYTYHPYWNYWIKVEKAPKYYGKDSFIKNEIWMECRSLLNKLRKRLITGDEARIAIKNFLNFDCSKKIEFWFNQIINRRIEVGYLLKSWEKQLGELVPKVSPMLAATWDETDIDEEVAIEPKLDGNRCLIIFDREGDATAISRNGLPFYNCEEVIAALEEQLDQERGLVFDGEMKAKNWGDTTSAAHSKTKKVKGLVYTIFDLLTLEEWEKKKCNRSYEERREKLKETILEENNHIKLISSTTYNSITAKELKQIRVKLNKQGYEGFVAKPADGCYEFKRSENWLKHKFKRTDDLKVVGAEEGKNGKRIGTLGALIVEGKVNGVKIRSRVGQGLEADICDMFWHLHKKKKLNGLIVEVEHYGVTDSLRKSKSNKLPALRNAVFLKVRNDKMER